MIEFLKTVDYLNPGIIFFLVSVIMIFIIIIASLWKLFEKANKVGWMSIVPGLNLIIFFEIASINPLFLVGFIIPYFNFIYIPIILLYVNVKFVKKFGKDTLFGVLSFFIPFFFFPIIAFIDDCIYEDEYKKINPKYNKFESYANDLELKEEYVDIDFIEKQEPVAKTKECMNCHSVINETDEMCFLCGYKF